MLYTYQDFEKCQSDKDRENFIQKAYSNYVSSTEYDKALQGEEYFKSKNRTIMRFIKWLYTTAGYRVQDPISANYKLPHNYFKRFVLDEVQYLLGNGISWEDEQKAVKVLGNDIDSKLQLAAKKALIGRISYNFYNLDHIEVFSATEFCPLWDEETGGLRAGIRFWQIDNNKPLRLTLYELDGYTEYIKRKSEELTELQGKKTYKLKITGDRKDYAEATMIIDGENYPTFPIVPLWGNQDHTYKIDELKPLIDCIDLIESGFANTIDETAEVFWILENAGGMDDVDLERFRERIKTLRAFVMEDDGAHAKPHTIDIPYQAREVLLERLRKELYESAMALDIQNIAGGAITATQIKASYEPLNVLCDDFEFCILDFLSKICELAGIEENPTFTRSTVVNVAEEVQITMQAAAVLPPEYIIQRILTLFGDKDKAEEIIQQIQADNLARFNAQQQTEPSNEE